MISRQVVAVSKDSDIYTLADLEGKRVAVQSTTKPDRFLRHIRMNGFLSWQKYFRCRIGN